MLLNHFYTKFHIDTSYSSSTNGVFEQLTLIDISKNTSNINQYVLLDFNVKKKKIFFFFIVE
jgi:hypothetical protein